MFAPFQTFKEGEGIIQRMSVHPCHRFNNNVIILLSLSFYLCIHTQTHTHTHTHTHFFFPTCIDDPCITNYFFGGCEMVIF